MGDEYHDEAFDEENEYMDLYKWIDGIPLSRPKRNITRDFSDGVLMSEVVKHYFPRLVDLHNYVKTNQVAKKVYNWKALNQKVFRRMGFLISDEDIEAVSRGEKGAVEEVLLFVQEKMAEYKEARAARRGSGGAAGLPEPVGRERERQAAPPPAGAAADGGGAPEAGMPPHRLPQGGAGASIADPGAPMRGMERRGSLGAQEEVRDLRDSVELLSARVERLEHLVSVKDTQIEALIRRVDLLSRR